MLVCDGGDAFEGCGRTFHLHCVKRTKVPPGDWICMDCAFEFGLKDVDQGYEFLDGGNSSRLSFAEAEGPDDAELSGRQGAFSPPVGDTVGIENEDDSGKGKRKSETVDSDDDMFIGKPKATKKQKVFLDSDDDDS